MAIVTPLSAVGAVGALVAVAGITGSRTAAVVAATLIALPLAGLLAMPATRLVSSHHRTRRWLGGAVIAVSSGMVAVLLSWLVFGPVPPSTAPLTTPDVHFWQLPTGSRIAYFHTSAQATARSTPVVLVHGGPGVPANRSGGLARDLAAIGFHVYDYDQIGAGLSGRLADVSRYTVDRHIADLDAIRQRLDAERLVLVGASWGGKLIANYLAAYPHRVAAAIIDSPSEIWSPAFSDAERLTAAGYRDQRAAVAEHPRFALAHALTRTVGTRTAYTLFPDSRMDGVFESFVNRIDKRPGCPAPRDLRPDGEGRPRGSGFWVNVMTTMDAERMADPRPALRGATAPVLVLRAECDYIAWEVTREYRDLLPNATLLAIADVGHTVTSGQPDLHRRLARAFLMGEPLPLPAYRAVDSPWS